MAAYDTTDYFKARVPDIETIIPGINLQLVCTAAMALYWDRFFEKTHPFPAISDDVLSERQKVLCALRAVMTLLPGIMTLLKPKVTEAEALPAKSKFEERYKLYKMWSDLWASELLQLEHAEGICFDLLPNVPAFRLGLKTAMGSNNPNSNIVISRGFTYIREGDDA
jgi:hypothetical protein